MPWRRVALTWNPAGGPAAVLRAGDVFHEPAGVPIARFDAGDEGVTFLGYFLLGAGENAEIEFPGQ